MIALGVTGTDTGVGKTVVTCAIAAACVRRGARVGVMKPVETGVEPPDAATDAGQLIRAGKSADPRASVSPYVFRDPVAPLVAGRRAGIAIDVGRMDGAYATISRDRDVVLVEGAGGLMAPITHELAFDGLCARWGLGLVIVAPDRLGVLSQVRLTVLAADRAALRVTAIVLNSVAPALRDASSGTNAAVLGELLPSVSIVGFPWMSVVSDDDKLAAEAERMGLPVALGLANAAAMREVVSNEDT